MSRNSFFLNETSEGRMLLNIIRKTIVMLGMCFVIITLYACGGGGGNSGADSPDSGPTNSDGENPGGENPGPTNPDGENPGGENPGPTNPDGENPSPVDPVVTQQPIITVNFQLREGEENPGGYGVQVFVQDCIGSPETLGFQSVSMFGASEIELFCGYDMYKDGYPLETMVIDSDGQVADQNIQDQFTFLATEGGENCSGLVARVAPGLDGEPAQNAYCDMLILRDVPVDTGGQSEETFFNTPASLAFGASEGFDQSCDETEVGIVGEEYADDRAYTPDEFVTLVFTASLLEQARVVFEFSDDGGDSWQEFFRSGVLQIGCRSVSTTVDLFSFDDNTRGYTLVNVRAYVDGVGQESSVERAIPVVHYYAYAELSSSPVSGNGFRFEVPASVSDNTFSLNEIFCALPTPFSFEFFADGTYSGGFTVISEEYVPLEHSGDVFVGEFYPDVPDLYLVSFNVGVLEVDENSIDGPPSNVCRPSYSLITYPLYIVDWR